MTTEPDPRQLMKVGELAALANVSKMTIYRLIYDNVLPAIRIGRSFRVKRADWDAYLVSVQHKPPQGE